MEFRRRVPRRMTSWVGYCHIRGEPVEQRRECRVVDISEFGVGIVLHHPQGAELIGRRLAVETPTFGASVNVQLDGEVRNAVPMGDGSVRLGIEFASLTALEQSVFKALGVPSDARDSR
jgi:hypothetical protein